MGKWNVKVAGNAQFNEGDGTQNNGSVSTVTVKQFFDKIAQALPADTTPETQAAHNAVNQLEAIAANPPEVPAEQDEQSFFNQYLAPYVTPLIPYAPITAKVLLAGGEGYFETLANKSAVVNMVLKMFQAARS